MLDASHAPLIAFIRIHRDDFGAGKEETANNQLDVDLRVTAFVMKQPAKATPSDKTAMTASAAVGEQIQ